MFEMNGSLIIISPLVTIERFSNVSGIPVRTLHRWIDSNQIPTQKIGKRRLINLVKLSLICLDDIDLDISLEH